MKVQMHTNVSAMETGRRNQKIGFRCFGLAVSALCNLACFGCEFIAPEDSNGNRPDELVRKFIELCEAEDYAAVKKLYYGAPEQGKPRTIEDFCARYKKIGLDNFEISKAVKGKADFWHVRIEFKEEGKQIHQFFYFKIVDGEWRIPRGYDW